MKNKQPSKPYPIPSRFSVKFARFWIGLGIFIDIIAVFLVYLLREEPLDKEMTLIVLGYFAVLVLLNLYYIFGPLFEYEFIELTETSIRYKSLFRDRFVKYNEIDSIEVIYVSKRGNALKILSTVAGIIQKPLVIPHEFKFVNINEADFIHTLDKMRT